MLPTDFFEGCLKMTLPYNKNGFVMNFCRVLWSKPIPIGWYFQPQWERQYGIRWAEKICDDWLKNDRYLKNFAAEVGN